MPGLFNFEDVGGGGGASGVGTVDPFDAVGILGNLWRRMQDNTIFRFRTSPFISSFAILFSRFGLVVW
jgi:hypothetical protein